MTETAAPPESYGHTSICADVTTNRKEYEALEITLLIEHDLIIELEEGRIHNASKKYREFTKIVAILFHGHHSPDEIRTALILAEDHLTVILEDGDIECAGFIRLCQSTDGSNSSLTWIYPTTESISPRKTMILERPDDVNNADSSSRVTVSMLTATISLRGIRQSRT